MLTTGKVQRETNSGAGPESQEERGPGAATQSTAATVSSEREALTGNERSTERNPLLDRSSERRNERRADGHEEKHERLRHDRLEAVALFNQPQMQPGTAAAHVDPSVSASGDLSYQEFLLESERAKRKKKGGYLESSFTRTLQTILPEEVVEDLISKIIDKQSKASALSADQVTTLAKQILAHKQDLVAYLALDGRHSEETILQEIAAHIVEASADKISPDDGFRIAEEIYQRETMTQIFDDVLSVSRTLAAQDVAGEHSGDESAESADQEFLDRLLKGYESFLLRYPHFREVIEQFATEQRGALRVELRLAMNEALAAAAILESSVQEITHSPDNTHAVRSIASILTVGDENIFLLATELAEDRLGTDLATLLESNGEVAGRLGSYLKERRAGNQVAHEAAYLFRVITQQESTQELISLLDQVNATGLTNDSQIQNRRAAVQMLERLLGPIDTLMPPGSSELSQASVQARLSVDQKALVLADVKLSMSEYGFSALRFARQLETLPLSQRREVVDELRESSYLESYLRPDQPEYLLVQSVVDGDALATQAAHFALVNTSRELGAVYALSLAEQDKPAFDALRDRYREMFGRDLLSELRGSEISPDARFLIEGLARGEQISPLQLRSIIERESLRIGEAIGRVEGTLSSDYGAEESRKQQLEFERLLLERSVQLLSAGTSRSGLSQIAQLQLQSARENGRLSVLVEQAWEFGYQAQHASGVNGRQDGSYFERAYQRLLHEQGAFIARHQPVDSAESLQSMLQEQYHNARIHVAERQERARTIASTMSSASASTRYLSGDYVKAISNGTLRNYQELETAARTGRVPNGHDEAMLRYIDQALRENHGRDDGLGFYIRKAHSRSEDAVSRLLDFSRAERDEKRFHGDNLAASITTSAVSLRELDMRDPVAERVLSIRQALLEQDGVILACQQIADLGEYRDQLLERYESTFSESIQQTVARYSRDDIWILDENASERDGILRGRKLTTANDLLGSALAGQAPSFEMVNEYALARLQDLGQREGTVLGTGLYEYQRSTLALEEIQREREILSERVAPLYDQFPELATIHEEFRHSHETLAREQAVRRQVEESLYLIELTSHQARQNSQNRVLQRLPQSHERNLSEFLRRNSEVAARPEFESYLQERRAEIRQVVSYNYRTASEAADSVHRAMHGGWNFGWLTDEDGVHDALRPLSEDQRKLALALYDERYNKNLYNDIIGEMSYRDRERAIAHADGRHRDAEQIGILQAGSTKSRNEALERSSALIAAEARRQQRVEIASLDEQITQARFRGDDSVANELQLHRANLARELENEDSVGANLRVRIEAEQDSFAASFNNRRASYTQTLEARIDRAISSQSAWESATDPELHRGHELAKAIREDQTKACEILEQEFDRFLEEYIDVKLNRTADGDIDFADTRLSEDKLRAFQDYLLSIESDSEVVQALQTAVRTRTSEKGLEGLFYDQRGALDEHMVRNFESFYRQTVLLPEVVPHISSGNIGAVPELSQAWQAHLADLTGGELFLSEMRRVGSVNKILTAGTDSQVREQALDRFVESQLSGARLEWFNALRTGDYAEAQAHKARYALNGFNSIRLLEDSFTTPSIITEQQENLQIALRLRQTELERASGHALSPEELSTDTHYSELERQLAFYASGAEALHERRSAVFAEHNGGEDLFVRIERETSRERAVVLRSVSEKGYVDDVAEIQIALLSSKARSRELLLQSVAGKSSAELDIIARELYSRENPNAPSDGDYREYFRERLLAQVSGDQRNDLNVLLVGEPETAEQMLQILALRHTHVRSGWTGFHDTFNAGLGKRFDSEFEAFESAYTDAVQRSLGIASAPETEEFQKAYLERLEQNYQGIEDDALREHREQYQEFVERGQGASLADMQAARERYRKALEERGATVVSAEELEVLRTMFESSHSTAHFARLAKNTVSDMAVDVAANAVVVVGTGVAIVLTVGTAGIGTAGGIAIAAGSAALGGVIRAGGGEILKGDGYGRHDFQRDLKSTAVDSGAAVAGFGIGAAATRLTTASVGRFATSRLAQQGSQRIVAEAVEGSIQATNATRGVATANSSRILGGSIRQGESFAQFGQRIVDSSRLARVATHGGVNAATEVPVSAVSSVFHVGIGADGFGNVSWNDLLNQTTRMTTMSVLIGAGVGGTMGLRTPAHIKQMQMQRSAGLSTETGAARQFAPELRAADVSERLARVSEDAVVARQRLDSDDVLSPTQRRELELTRDREPRLQQIESDSSRDMDRRFRSSDRAETVEAQRELAKARTELELHETELRVRKQHVEEARKGGEAELREAELALQRAKQRTNELRTEVRSAERVLGNQQRVDVLLEGVAEPKEALRSAAQEIVSLRRQALAEVRSGNLTGAFHTLRDLRTVSAGFARSRAQALRNQRFDTQNGVHERVEQALVSRLPEDVQGRVQAELETLRGQYLRADTRVSELTDSMRDRLTRAGRFELPEPVAALRTALGELSSARPALRDARTRYNSYLALIERAGTEQYDVTRILQESQQLAVAAQSQAARHELTRMVRDIVTLRPGQAIEHWRNRGSAAALRDELRVESVEMRRAATVEIESRKALRGLDAEVYGDLAEQAALARVASADQGLVERSLSSVRSILGGSSSQQGFQAVGQRADRALARAAAAQERFDVYARQFGGGSAGEQRAARMVDLEGRLAMREFELAEARIASGRNASPGDDLQQNSAQRIESLQKTVADLEGEIALLRRTSTDGSSATSDHVVAENVDSAISRTRHSVVTNNDTTNGNNFGSDGPALTSRPSAPRTPAERYDFVAELLGTDDLSRVRTTGMQRGDSFITELDGQELTVTLSHNGRVLYVDDVASLYARRSNGGSELDSVAAFYDRDSGTMIAPRLEQGATRGQRLLYGATLAHENAHASGLGEFGAWKATAEYLSRNGASLDLSGNAVRIRTSSEGGVSMPTDADIQSYIARAYGGDVAMKAQPMLLEEAPVLERVGVLTADDEYDFQITRPLDEVELRAALEEGTLEQRLARARELVEDARARLDATEQHDFGEFQQYEQAVALQDAREQLTILLRAQRELQQQLTQVELAPRTRPVIEPGEATTLKPAADEAIDDIRALKDLYVESLPIARTPRMSSELAGSVAARTNASTVFATKPHMTTHLSRPLANPEPYASTHLRSPYKTPLHSQEDANGPAEQESLSFRKGSLVQEGDEALATSDLSVHEHDGFAGRRRKIVLQSGIAIAEDDPGIDPNSPNTISMEEIKIG